MRHPRPFTVLASLAAALACRAGLAQFGQMPMSPAGGVANRAAAGLAELNQNGPGWLYYGINAADRGLGYYGSYMTLGGYIPYSEDGLGGLWAADLRSHLSVNGGFFSNVGAVRKQLLGGTLLGIGVYWDYDGDQNQYPAAGLAGAQWGQFGHSYNQVGVSGEWLTDFGNLRSNGYIPVGTTAYTIGAPGSPFYGNNILCSHGLDTALSGADLEVGAYIPGLTDWAGMVSVGGYALGNDRYDWWSGPQAGRDVVPWFGGVYTRLDMTFLENWDFSLQANNDSYFDWTGFARLTYRMGGSRRRNVPDQMEQPMMRNEHIVRAHQTPIAAVNPVTGAAWNVIHVDNTVATIGGNGTVEAPYRTLAQAQSAAIHPYDVVFVHTGSSSTSPYESNWRFQADNQILVGAGSTLELATANCGLEQFFNTGTSGRFPTTEYPVLTSSGTAITLRNGAIVDHLVIREAGVGIAGDSSLTGGANVNDVRITGTNSPGQAGIQLVNVPGGNVNLYNMSVTNAWTGLAIDGGAPVVQFQGLISQRDSGGPSLSVQNMTGGGVGVNADTVTLDTPLARNPRFLPLSYAISDASSTAPAAIEVSLNTSAYVVVGPTDITTPTQQGVSIQGNSATEVEFLDLSVVNAAAQAFSSQGNINNSLVRIAAGSLSSLSTTLPAFASTNTTNLSIELDALTSQTFAPTPAITLQGTSNGNFTIDDRFTVQITNPSPPPATVSGPGTAANNVLNTTAVGVDVP